MKIAKDRPNKNSKEEVESTPPQTMTSVVSSLFCAHNDMCDTKLFPIVNRRPSLQIINKKSIEVKLEQPDMLWNCHNPERRHRQNLFCQPFDHQREDKLIRLLIPLSLID